MADETYNPDQARALIPGVSASTIRNWCKDFAPMLSDGANPPTGRERRLTLGDIAKLQQVKALRESGRRVEDIRNLLQAAASSSEPALLTIDAVATPQATQTSQDATDGPTMLPAVLQSIDSRFQAIEHRIEAQAQEARAAQRDRLTMLVLGGLGGILLTVGALAAWVWMVGNG